MPDYKNGTCRWCKEKGKVYRDNLLCETCDSDTIYCSVCRQRYSYDYPCRHVFQDAHCEWRGSGVRAVDDQMRLPFHRLLSAMGEDFARSLKVAIESGKFHTWTVAPLIGGGGSLTLYGMPDREGCEPLRDGWGDQLIDLGSSPRAAIFADGYHWLVSLYDRDTKKANQATIAWIDSWLWPLSPG